MERIDINPEILRQCREQVGLSLEAAAQKLNIKTLDKMEAGERMPTFGQLDRLAEKYFVPGWVFTKEHLPERFNFQGMPSFRKLTAAASRREDGRSGNLGDQSGRDHQYSITAVLTHVKWARELMLDVRKDLGLDNDRFEKTALDENGTRIDPAQAARQIRAWLNCEDGVSHSFEEWREKLEEKHIFVFMTSKYNDKLKLKVDIDAFRGLSIFHRELPVIVINDSDHHGAQSFTLMHELGHLLLGDDAIDAGAINQHLPMPNKGADGMAEERWCDAFAGEVLMPEPAFRAQCSAVDLAAAPEAILKAIGKRVARNFQVSLAACIVRMSHLGIIGSNHYQRLWKTHQDLLKKKRARLKERGGGARRNIKNERLRQYGRLYTNSMLDGYFQKDITLAKLCRFMRMPLSHTIDLKDRK